MAGWHLLLRSVRKYLSYRLCEINPPILYTKHDAINVAEDFMNDMAGRDERVVMD